MAKGAQLTEESSLQLYLREIGRKRPLSHKEEVELSGRIRNGDHRALEEMVLANLRFVVSVARNYEHQGLPLSDLINEGNLGLIKAAQRFDGAKNFKFISYAVWWIRQSILQALAEQSRIVNLPLNRVGTIYKIGKALKKLEQRYFRTPDAAEVAREIHVREREVNESMRIGDRHVSLDSPIDEDDSARVIDSLSDARIEMPDDCLMEMSMQEEIHRTLDLLNEREQEVVRLYFGLGEETPHTLEDIGKRLKLTRERARQIKENALRRLRGTRRSGRLRSFAL
jgi:RNA polymerase primary sigma factor